MPSKITISMKISGFCGILAPVIALGCIGLAILISPWFSWTENYLSDLGGFPGDTPVWAAHGAASVLFNLGLVIAGILGILFGLGLRKDPLLKTRLGSIGTIFYLLDAGALIGIGVFPETTGAPHTLFSFVFFILAGFSLCFIGIAQLRSSKKVFGYFTIILFIFGLFAVPLLFMPRPLGANAVAEIIPVISISLFSVVFGYGLLKLDSEKEKKEESSLKN